MLEDDSPMLVSPEGCVLEKVFPSQFLLRPILLPEGLFDLGLGGDPGVVGSGNPYDGFARTVVAIDGTLVTVTPESTSSFPFI